MSEISDRYRRVAGDFSRRVDAVSAARWDDLAPCDGWVARDVVRHLVEWVPSLLFGPVGLESDGWPSVDDDPAGAWHAFDAIVQRALEDPAIATQEFDIRPGRFSFENAMAMLVIGDLVVHTWDLARATGGDERLDADLVHEMLVGMEPMDEMLRQSGQYGPKVAVPADADEQTRLIAFTGRQP